MSFLVQDRQYLFLLCGWTGRARDEKENILILIGFLQKYTLQNLHTKKLDQYFSNADLILVQ